MYAGTLSYFAQLQAQYELSALASKAKTGLLTIWVWYNCYNKIGKDITLNTAIINKLKELKPILKERYGIEEFAVFGSVAKGTDTAKSDVDIAVLKLNLKDAFALFEAKEYLVKSLNKPVDIGTFNSMKTFVKNRIQKDFIYVWNREYK